MLGKCWALSRYKSGWFSCCLSLNNKKHKYCGGGRMKKRILVFLAMIPALLYLTAAETIERGRGKLNAPFDHTISYSGAMHKAGLLKPYYVNPRAVGAGVGKDPELEGTSGGCVVCHGEASGFTDLTGGVKENGLTPPARYSCHTQNWVGFSQTPTARLT